MKRSNTWAILFILIGYFILNTSATSAQSLEQEKYTLEVNEATYPVLIDTLSQIANLNFIYSDDNIPLIRKESILLEDEPISYALDILFDGRFLSYTLDGRDVIIKVVRSPFDSKAGMRMKRHTINGTIKDANTGEDLLGTTVIIQELGSGVVANDHGFYSISLPKGPYKLIFRSIGYKKRILNISLQSDTLLNIKLDQSERKLKEVVVVGNKEDEDADKRRLQSSTKLNPTFVKELPSLLGESDIIRTLQMMPGVQVQSEGATGYSIRGGSTDQNLVLVDDTPIYNISHLLGLYSVFNPDAVKGVELYKAGIPAHYGGRLSSLLDIRLKEGNDRNFSIAGGLGSMAGRILLEGPIQKEKSSFIFSARRSYLDLLFPIDETTGSGFGTNVLNFYDINFKASFQVSEKNRLNLSVYSGRDKLGIQNITTSDWGNNSVSLRWRSTLTPKLFSTTNAWYTSYQANTLLNFVDIYGYTTSYALDDYGLSQKFSYFPTPSLTINAGAETTLHTYEFGEIIPTSNETVLERKESTPMKSLETSAYINFDQEITPHLNIRYGLRYTQFDSFTKKREFVYDVDEVVSPDTSEENIIDTLYHDNQSEIANTYRGLEPRVSLNVLIDQDNSIRLSYDHTRQYLHQMAVSSIPTPTTGIWVPVDQYLPPQIGNQYSVSYTRYFRDNQFELSIEGYYKSMDNQIDFQANSGSTVTEHLETDILIGKGYAYGTELLFRKRKGDFTGWVSYTYSKSERQIEGINNNLPYPTNFDRRHDISIVTNYKLTDQINLSANWVYSSGLAYTFPVGKYNIGDTQVPVYTSRNGFRLPDTHHLDLSCTFYRRMTEDKRNESSFSFSIYNVYGRKNPFAYVFRQSNYNASQTEAVKLYLFTVLPAFSYNFRF